MSVNQIHADSSFTNTVLLEHGATVKGRVTDIDGKPIENAIVFSDSTDDVGTKTNANGEYVLENLPESEEAYIGVWSPGKMSTIKEFTFKKNASPVIDVVMKPAGKPLKIKVVDKDGKPVKGFYIGIERWENHRLVDSVLQTGKFVRTMEDLKHLPQTNENGQWVWNEAPENEVFFDMLSQDNSLMEFRNQPMTAREDEYVFTVVPALNVTGKVLDAVTKKTILAYKVFWGIKHEDGEVYWTPQSHVIKEGLYSLSEKYPHNGFAVKIEADGYEPAISRDIKPDEGTITVDFSLQKLSAAKLSQRLQGIILTPDGKPAANATVALSTAKMFVSYINGDFQDAREPYITKTNKDGAFKFAYIDFAKERESKQNFSSEIPASDYTLHISHESGFRRLTQNDRKIMFKEKPITLEKWGCIEGTVYAGTKPQKEVLMNFAPTLQTIQEPRSDAYYGYSAKSDAEGKFVFAQVPVGQGLVQQGIPVGKRNHFFAGGTKVDILSGETVTVKMGGNGRPVIGKLILDRGSETPPDWNYCSIRCCPPMTKLDPASYPTIDKKIPESIMRGWDSAKATQLLEEWASTTEEGKAYTAAIREFQAQGKKNEAILANSKLCIVSPEGTFRFYDIPEGDWELRVELRLPPSETPAPYGDNTIIGTLEHQFTMEAIPGGVSDEPMDVGVLAVKSIEQPKPLTPAGQTAAAR